MAESHAKLRRRAAVTDAYRAGMAIPDIEKKYGITAATIQVYLREEKIRTAEKKEESIIGDLFRAYRTSVVNPDILLSEIDMRGDRKGTIRRWAKKQIGSTLKTPEGDMIITAAYPYIFECLKNTQKRVIKTTYTHAQLYYMNQEDTYGTQA